jgi:hypothetical protein
LCSSFPYSSAGGAEREEVEVVYACPSGCKPDYAALAPTDIEHARKSHRARTRTDPKSGRADAGTVLRALAVLITPPLVEVSRGRE